MRQLFEQFSATIEGFIEQSEKLALRVRADVRAYIALLKIVETVEQGAAPHLVLSLAHDFHAPDSYAETLIRELKLRHQLLCEKAAAEGEAVPRPLPELVSAAGATSLIALRSLFMHYRSLIPDLTHARLVVALLPSKIAEPAGFDEFVDSLLAHDFPAPWCHHMRFIIRTEASAEQKGAPAARSTSFTPDLSDAAIEQALEREVDDATRSVPERMQALLLSAGMDVAHHRPDAALEKYRLVAGFHARLGQLPALALALNGMGEAHLRAGRTREAIGHFERALTPSVKAKDLPSLIPVTYNLARVYQDSGELQRAYDYYGALSTLARAALSAVLQLICHTQRGKCLTGLGRRELALREWEAGAELAKGSEMPEQELELLTLTHDLLGELGRRAEQRPIRQRMGELQRQLEVHR